MSVDTNDGTMTHEEQEFAKLVDAHQHLAKEVDDLKWKLLEADNEVDRLRDDARKNDEDCAQALRTNGELLLAAAKAEHTMHCREGHRTAQEAGNCPKLHGVVADECSVCKAIAVCEEKP